MKLVWVSFVCLLLSQFCESFPQTNQQLQDALRAIRASLEKQSSQQILTLPKDNNLERLVENINANLQEERNNEEETNKENVESETVSKQEESDAIFKESENNENSEESDKQENEDGENVKKSGTKKKFTKVRTGFQNITPADIDQLLSSRQNTRRMVDCVLDFEKTSCPTEFRGVSEMASGIFRNGGRCVQCNVKEQKLIRRFLIKLQRERTPEYRRLINGLNKF